MEDVYSVDAMVKFIYNKLLFQGCNPEDKQKIMEKELRITRDNKNGNNDK